MNKYKILTLSLLLSPLLNACGGGSDGDTKSLVVFEGELTQGMGETHADRQDLNFVKHAPGEGIEDVQICALGKCSKTDANGSFGFGAPESYDGGEVEFSVSGHFTEAKQVINVPVGAKNVFIHFEKHSSSEVHIHHLMIDGKEVE